MYENGDNAMCTYVRSINTSILFEVFYAFYETDSFFRYLAIDMKIKSTFLWQKLLNSCLLCKQNNGSIVVNFFVLFNGNLQGKQFYFYKYSFNERVF